MTDKRTEEQRNFDWALHGIAFSHPEMARGKWEQAEMALSKIPHDEVRRDRLEYWRKQLGI